MAPPRPLPELIHDATSEILLRIPPEEPAHLFRAALVCMLWRRILSDPAFLRRYRIFHRTPPMLGFFYNVDRAGHDPCFAPITESSPVAQLASYCSRVTAIDCRHGRLLLREWDSNNLVVWDPVTGERENLHWPDFRFIPYTAVVLCAVVGCDHHNCHGTPFVVVIVGLDSNPIDGAAAYACAYTSESRAWGTPVFLHFIPSFVNFTRHGTLIRDEIYFVVDLGARILKYDIGRNYLSVINTPNFYHRGFVLMPTDGDLLGLVGIMGSSLCLWSRKVNAEGIEEWVQCRVIDLEKLMPTCRLGCLPKVIGAAEGLGVIFVSTDFV